MLRLILINKVLYILLACSSIFYIFIWMVSRSELKGILGSGSDIAFIYLYNLASDKSYFEFFQYNLLLWCGIVALIISLKNDHKNTLFLSFIYIYLLVDDLFRIHDSVGPIYIEKFLKMNLNLDHLNNWIRIKDLCEIIVWLIVGLVIVIVMLFKYKSFSNSEKVYLYFNFIFWFILAFFGIFIDVIGANKELYFNIEINNILINGIFTFIEEVGEISCIICLFLFLYNYNEYLSKNIRIKNIKFSK